MVFGGKKLIYNLVFASITYCCLIQGKDKEQLQIFFFDCRYNRINCYTGGLVRQWLVLQYSFFCIFSLQSRNFLTPTNIAIVVAFLVVTIVINNSFEYLRPIVEGVLKKRYDND